MDITIIIAKLKEEMKKLFATKEDVPTKTSDLINDNDFVTTASIPTKTSDLVNDVGFLIEHQDITNKENISNKITSLSSSSTDTQYPSAKLVYDQLLNFVKKNEVKNNLTSTDTQLPLSAKQGKELKTLVDSKANSNHTHDNISDTGWQEVIFESGYAKYGDPVRYRRIGKVVHIEGIIKNTSAFTPSETAKKVATISDIYCRPQYTQYGLMQGTGANKFLLSIQPNGNIGIARYGTTTTSTQIGANSWLHCNLTWMVETENVSYVTSFESSSGFTYYYPDGFSYNQGNPLPAPFKLQKDNGEGIANQSIKFYIDNTLKNTQTTDSNGYVLFEVPFATMTDTNNTHTLRVTFEENAPYRPCTYTWTVGQNSNDDPIIA